MPHNLTLITKAAIAALTREIDMTTDYYYLAVKSPEGRQYIKDGLLTKPVFLELMCQSGCEREKIGFGTWSSDDGFKFWPVTKANGDSIRGNRAA